MVTQIRLNGNAIDEKFISYFTKYNIHIDKTFIGRYDYIIEIDDENNEQDFLEVNKWLKDNKYIISEEELTMNQIMFQLNKLKKSQKKTEKTINKYLKLMNEKTNNNFKCFVASKHIDDINNKMNLND